MSRSSIERVVAAVDVSIECAPSVVAKAEQIMRLLQLKLPVGVKKLDSCRQLFAVELACRQLSVAFNKDHLIDQAIGISLKDYQSGATTFTNLLGLQIQTNNNIIDLLSIRLNPALKLTAIGILAQFRQQFVDKLEPSRRQNYDLNSPVFHAAAFFLAAHKSKVKLARKSVCDAAEVDSFAFKGALEAMGKVIVPEFIEALQRVPNDCKKDNREIGTRIALEPLNPNLESSRLSNDEINNTMQFNYNEHGSRIQVNKENGNEKSIKSRISCPKSGGGGDAVVIAAGGGGGGKPLDTTAIGGSTPEPLPGASANVNCAGTLNRGESTCFHSHKVNRHMLQMQKDGVVLVQSNDLDVQKKQQEDNKKRKNKDDYETWKSEMLAKRLHRKETIET